MSANVHDFEGIASESEQHLLQQDPANERGIYFYHRRIVAHLYDTITCLSML